MSEKNSFENITETEQKEEVYNVIGSDDFEHESKYSSWLDLWEKNKGEIVSDPFVCPACREKKIATTMAKWLTALLEDTSKTRMVTYLFVLFVNGATMAKRIRLLFMSRKRDFCLSHLRENNSPPINNN